MSTKKNLEKITKIFGNVNKPYNIGQDMQFVVAITKKKNCNFFTSANNSYFVWSTDLLGLYFLIYEKIKH